MSTPPTDTRPQERPTGAADELWGGVIRLINRHWDTPNRLAQHGLAPLAAEILLARGTAAPGTLQRHLKRARATALTAQFLLARIREACDGSILLVKGPEVAIRYPHGARGYGD